jgi:hypothetical protein
MRSRDGSVADLLVSLDQALRLAGKRWYLFGAQAAILYGAARLTADVDVTVDVGDRPVRELLNALDAGGFGARFPFDDAFIATTRVLPLVHERSGLPVDVVLAGAGLEQVMLERVRLVDVRDATIPVVAPDDLIVLKILAGRPKDLEDVESLLAAGSVDDLAQARETLRLLEQALDESDLVPRLEESLRRAARSTRKGPILDGPSSRRAKAPSKVTEPTSPTPASDPSKSSGRPRSAPKPSRQRRR